MAEFSEAHDSDSSKLRDNGSEAPQRPEYEPDFDPKLMRFPFLWKSVEIYRSPLPFNEIDSLSTQLRSDNLLLPLHFHALFVGFDSYPDSLRRSILSEIAKLTSQNPKCCNNYTLSVTVDLGSRCLRSPTSSSHSSSYQCRSITATDFVQNHDVSVDERLASVFGGKSKGYGVVVVKGGSERAVVGKHRHSWMVVGDGSEVEVAAVKVAELLVKVFINGGREEESIRNEFMPIGADGKIVLSFNLLNADPRDWVFDWDFEKMDDTLLAPMIEALGPVANISVESQVLFHTPKASFSYRNQKLDSYVFSTKDLPFFVNSNEWHLDTSIAAGGQSKILQFADLENMFEVFIGQFRQLFGFKSVNVYAGASGDLYLLPSERGFTECSCPGNWMSCHGSKHVLIFLHVQSLPMMIIMDEIGKQVKFSLEAAKLALSNASSGMCESSAASSSKARSLAEDAFFHPSIMSVSYYSFEHCFAVYSPFLLPVSMHVMLAALRELRRYKQEKAKYLAWKAKEKQHLKYFPVSKTDIKQLHQQQDGRYYKPWETFKQQYKI
ncbi:putative GTP-binding protein-plant [Hibiscus syriacus]|uniref:GTP-binding protein-plant n=1 Tax=Hibiscus syriacus TaxID=106335 RepID=A0A6A3CTL8_HIBSY|nr:putative GTP-binding protein-plant [Hibiscus syriacus]